MFLSFEKFKGIPIRDIYTPDFIIKNDFAEINSKNPSGYYAGKLECTMLLSDLYNPAADVEPLCCFIKIPYIKSGFKTKAWGLISFADQ